MRFARPDYLYLLALVPLVGVLLVWAARRKRAALSRFGSPMLARRVWHGVSARRRRWKAALVLFSLCAVVFALARPIWGSRVEVKAQQGVQVMVVLDVSASMLAEDLKPNRLERAKLVIEELLDRLGGNDVGFVVFSGSAFIQFPLTNSMDTARSFVGGAGPESVSRPGTALGEAIRVALAAFPEERSASRAILLLTDGEGHEDDPVAAARQAAEREIPIYSLGFGSPTGEPIPLRDDEGALTGYKTDARGETVLSRLDEAILQRIAQETGGAYYRSSAQGDEIDMIVEDIVAMATGETEERFEVTGVERHMWLAGLAAILLTAEALLRDRSRRGRGESARGGRVA